MAAVHSVDLERQLSEANNKLAVKIYQELVARQRFQNVLFCPLGLTLSLIMAADLSQGKTKDDISASLSLPMGDDLVSLTKDIISSLLESPIGFCVNMFVDETLSGIESFQNRSFPNLGIMNFQMPKVCEKLINNWAAKDSGNTIENLLLTGSISSRTKFVAANGASYKTNWKKPFIRNYTKLREFEIGEDDVVQTEMMDLIAELKYGFSEKLSTEIIELEAQETDVTMVILLPEYNIISVEDKMDRVDLFKEMKFLRQTPVRIRLPKFAKEERRNFKDVLQSIHLEEPFREQADFSLLSKRKPFTLSSIFQKAVIQVNEGGQQRTTLSGYKDQVTRMNCDRIPLQENLDEHYILGDIIARGQFSIVHKCLYKGKIERACRTYDKNNVNLVKLVDHLEDVLETVHPNLIRIYEGFHTPDEVHLITERVYGEELFERIVDLGHYSEREASSLLKDILSALLCLHKKGIIHGDIRPESLLYSNNGREPLLKLRDVSFSKCTPNTHTTVYIAPEKNEKPTTATDIWSLGIVLYIMLCGIEPGTGDIITELVPGFTLPWWQDISQQAKNLIQKLLEIEPEMRLTAEDALNNPWVQGKVVKEEHLEQAVERLKEFNAKAKFRVASKAILATRKMNLLFQKRIVSQIHVDGTAS